MLKIQTFTEGKYFLPAVLFLLYTWILINALRSGGFSGGSDEIAHYQIARYSWQYPELLLNHWGKPFYTLISSSFAQFGIPGMKVMNALLGFLTALLTYAIARHTGIS